MAGKVIKMLRRILVVSSSLKLKFFVVICLKSICVRRGKLMDLSPFRQNFEKNRNGQKYHHSLKEHPTFTKIAKFGGEML